MIKIVQLVEKPDDSVVIYVAVSVDKHVPEASGRRHGRSEVIVDDTVRGKRPDRVGVGVRCCPALGGDDVVCDADTTFDRGDEAVLHRIQRINRVG